MFVPRGRLSRRERIERIAALKALTDTAPRIALATGKLVGEGIHHAPLDTLFLVLPISWRSTLRQDAGRVSRSLASKIAAVIHDYLDVESLVLMRMWQRRSEGYKSIGCLVAMDDETGSLTSASGQAAP